METVEMIVHVILPVDSGLFNTETRLLFLRIILANVKELDSVLSFFKLEDLVS